ncbi:DnaB-like helicase C-terminal domain-containing protein [Streptomyces roseifaciens]
MSTIEEEVISYVATTGDLEAVVQGGITVDHFLDPKNRSVYRDVLSYHSDFGEAPTPDVILRDHPGYTFTPEGSGPITYLLRELREERRKTILDLGLGAVAEALDTGGSEAAMPLLRTMLAQVSLETEKATEVDYASTGPERLERYRQARENPGALVGMPTGFVFLDRVTLGIQAQQMLVLTGVAKSCKTTVMLGILRAVYDWGATPLVISFEMPEVEISRRLDGFAAQVNPRQLQTGELSEAEWRRLECTLTLREREETPRPFLISEDRAGTMTLSGIQAKIDQLRPNVLFVDGAYFLFDEVSRETQTPLALTNISRGLKKLALNNGMPVIVTTQSLSHKIGAKGLTAHSLGYTSAWVQDADAVIGMEATDESFVFRMKVLVSRNAPPQERLITISWDPPRFEEEELDVALPY